MSRRRSPSAWNTATAKRDTWVRMAKKAPAQTKKAPAAKQAAADDEFDWETFLALPTLILFWVVTYAVLQEEEED